MFSKAIKLIENNKDLVVALRKEDKFKVLFPKVISDAKKLELNKAKVPYQRKVPIKFDNNLENDVHFNIETYIFQDNIF